MWWLVDQVRAGIIYIYGHDRDHFVDFELAARIKASKFLETDVFIHNRPRRQLDRRASPRSWRESCFPAHYRPSLAYHRNPGSRCGLFPNRYNRRAERQYSIREAMA